MAEIKSLKDWVKSEHKRFEVVGIEGGKDLKEYLEDLGIKEGEEIKLKSTFSHKHRGPLAVEIQGKEIVLAQGIADKVIVKTGNGKHMRLLELEAGDDGVIIGIEGGKKIKDELEQLGLKEGENIKVKGHLAEENYTIVSNGNQIELCTGEASKLLIKVGDRIFQLCQLEVGAEGKFVDIISGIALEERLKKAGIEKGKNIKLISRKSTTGPAKHIGCIFYLTVLGGTTISIGHGMAEKIMVSPLD